jgi:predicted dinucleotide-binding enzyme
MDVTNPIVSNGSGNAPALDIGYPRSGGETMQKWIPEAHVVKVFNIITASYMANPKLSEGTPDMFLCGDNEQAKEWVTKIASDWGWTVHDLGKLDQAYLLEALAMIWIRFGFPNNHWTHAFKLLMK